MNLLVLTFALATSPADVPKAAATPTFEVREEALKMADGGIRLPPKGSVNLADGGIRLPPKAPVTLADGGIRLPPKGRVTLADGGIRLPPKGLQG